MTLVTPTFRYKLNLKYNTYIHTYIHTNKQTNKQFSLVVDDETHGEVSLTWRPPNESDDIIGYVVQFR